MGFHTEKRMCACIPSSLPSTICAFISTHITQLYVHYFKRFFKRISNHIKHIGSAQQPKCHWNTITGVKFSSSYPSHCLLSVLSALVSPPLGIIQQETLLQVRDRGKVAVGTLTLNFLSSERLKSQSSSTLARFLSIQNTAYVSVLGLKIKVYNWVKRCLGTFWQVLTYIIQLCSMLLDFETYQYNNEEEKVIEKSANKL